MSSWLSATMVTQHTDIRSEKMRQISSTGGVLCFHLSSSTDTDPPLLVLLAVHHDHLALGEGQLVGVVGYTVVDGFDALRPLLLKHRLLLLCAGNVPEEAVCLETHKAEEVTAKETTRHVFIRGALTGWAFLGMGAGGSE